MNSECHECHECQDDGAVLALLRAVNTIQDVLISRGERLERLEAHQCANGTESLDQLRTDLILVTEIAVGVREAQTALSADVTECLGELRMRLDAMATEVEQVRNHSAANGRHITAIDIDSRSSLDDIEQLRTRLDAVVANLERVRGYANAISRTRRQTTKARTEEVEELRTRLDAMAESLGEAHVQIDSLKTRVSGVEADLNWSNAVGPPLDTVTVTRSDGCTPISVTYRDGDDLTWDAPVVQEWPE